MTSEASERLKRFPAFSGASYRKLNPDVGGANVDPYEHALTFGALEGRRLLSTRDMAQAWGASTAHVVRALGSSRDRRRSTGDLRFSPERKLMILVSSASGAHDQLLAAALRSTLGHAGMSVAIGDERTRISDDTAFVIVAPHVFYFEGSGPAWRLSGLVRNSFVLNTADLQTREFERALPFLMAGRGVIDLAPQMVEMVGASGVPAHLFPPCRLLPDGDQASADATSPLARSLYIPDLDAESTSDAWSRRPLDCCFFGDNSHRRSQVFGRLAGRLADDRNLIYLAQGFEDRIERAVEHGAWAHVFSRAARASKITLSIARDELLQVDWAVVYQAMTCGSVVVVDGAVEHPEIAAGTHVFASNARYIPEMIGWLRDASDGRRAATRARAACFDLLDAAERAAGSALAGFLGLCGERDLQSRGSA